MLTLNLVTFFDDGDRKPTTTNGGSPTPRDPLTIKQHDAARFHDETMGRWDDVVMIRPDTVAVWICGDVAT